MKTEQQRIKEIKDSVKANIKWGDPQPHVSGGYLCGTLSRAVTLTSEELEFKVEVGFSRSQLKNKEVAFALFELALDEFVR